jgi:hypothetical protein
VIGGKAEKVAQSAASESSCGQVLLFGYPIDLAPEDGVAVQVEQGPLWHSASVRYAKAAPAY